MINFSSSSLVNNMGFIPYLQYWIDPSNHFTWSYTLVYTDLSLKNRIPMLRLRVEASSRRYTDYYSLLHTDHTFIDAGLKTLFRTHMDLREPPWKTY